MKIEPIEPISKIQNKMENKNLNQSGKRKSKMEIENEIPNPLSDNRLAIRMLNSVSEIISEIERDDEDMIELNLNELKTRLSQFEKAFYDNKQKGTYRQYEYYIDVCINYIFSIKYAYYSISRF